MCIVDMTLNERQYQTNVDVDLFTFICVCINNVIDMCIYGRISLITCVDLFPAKSRTFLQIQEGYVGQ